MSTLTQNPASYAGRFVPRHKVARRHSNYGRSARSVAFGSRSLDNSRLSCWHSEFLAMNTNTNTTYPVWHKRLALKSLHPNKTFSRLEKESMLISHCNPHKHVTNSFNIISVQFIHNVYFFPKQHCFYTAGDPYLLWCWIWRFTYNTIIVITGAWEGLYHFVTTL